VQFGVCRPPAIGGIGSYNLTKDETESGWVYGGGVETKISKYWSLRAEYLRYDFGKQTYELGVAPSGKKIGTKVVDQDLDVVRFALNYRLSP
jgi:outer membrane immunogenic protein